jgi:hypothetical protein
MEGNPMKDEKNTRNFCFRVPIGDEVLFQVLKSYNEGNRTELIMCALRSYFLLSREMVEAEKKRLEKSYLAAQEILEKQFEQLEELREQQKRKLIIRFKEMKKHKMESSLRNGSGTYIEETKIPKYWLDQARLAGFIDETEFVEYLNREEQ